MAGVPRRLATALVLFSVGYWELQAAFYGAEGRIGPASDEMATHSHSPAHPHGPGAPDGMRAPPERAATPGHAQ